MSVEDIPIWAAIVMAILGTGTATAVVTAFLERRSREANTGLTDAQATDVLVKAGKTAVEILTEQLERALVRIEALETVAVEKDARIAHLEKAESEKDKRIRSLEETVTELEVHIAKLEERDISSTIADDARRSADDARRAADDARRVIDEGS
jgi:cell division protein FtsB